MRIRASQLLLSSIVWFLASVAAADTPSACTGEVLATYRGVPAFSNAPYQGGFDVCGPYGQDGWQYTCVEYVRRFYRLTFGIDTSIANGWTGDAKDLYPPGAKKDLIGFSNGMSTVPPEADDILVFDKGGKDGKGHVSIITSVSGSQVSLIDENYPTQLPSVVTLSQDMGTGYWSIAPRQKLPVKGWMRLKRRAGGTPTFAPKFDLPTGTEPLGLSIADFDGDGKNDIAVTVYNNGNGDHLTIFRNSGSTPGNLNFDVPVDVPTGRGPEGVIAGDLDNDGKVDLVTANPGDSTVTVLRNHSTKGFIDFEPVLLSLPAPPTPHRVVIADFDGDGRPDLIFTSNNGRIVSVFHHASDPNTIAFDYRMDFGTGDFLNELAVVDLDHDMRPEILVPLQDTGELMAFQNLSTSGNVQASALPPFPTGSMPKGIAAGDLNNDQLPDVLVTETGGVGIFQNHSSQGVFNLSRTDITTGTNPQAVAIGDLDRDGFLDAVVTNPSGNTLTVLHNTTQAVGAAIGLTALQTPLETGMNPINLVLGDLDGDGWLDIVVANHDAGTISVILNTTAHP
jgi:hypothetical protein